MMEKLEMNDHLLEKALVRNCISRKARKLNDLKYSENPDDYIYLSGKEDSRCYKIKFHCKTNDSTLIVEIGKL